MKFHRFIAITLPLTLSGCLTHPQENVEPVYGKPMTRAQIEQTKIKVKQRQQIVQKNKTHNVQVYQDNRSYPGTAPGFAPAYGQKYYNAETHAYNQQVYRQVQNQQQQQQDDLAAEEARRMEQAKQYRNAFARGEGSSCRRRGSC